MHKFSSAKKGGGKLYGWVEAKAPRIAPYLHLFLFFCALIALDLGLRWMCRFAQVVGLANTLKLMPFTLGWALLLTGLAALLPRRGRQVYMTVVGLAFSLLSITHGVYINMFRKFFSFADMAFAGDGAAFADLSYLVIRKLLLAWILLCFLVVVVAVLLTPPRARSRWRLGGIGAAVGIAIILVTRFAILGKSQAVIWNQNSDPAFLYEDFSDSRACLTMLGLYQYTFRDLQMLLPRGGQLTEEERSEIADFAAQRGHEANEMSGIFEGKNLILVQLEAIDTWMLEGYMPSLRAVKEQSIVFSNHYTPAYITAGTFNTEFMVNAGLLPATSSTSMSVYTHNAFPNSLAHLFRDKGYSANSFHGSEGSVYNREAIHENLGFEAYHSGTDMGMADYTMDSEMINAFDQMTGEEPFFTFIITYSGHGPYGEDNPIYQAHAEEAQAEAERTDGNYVYAVGHAKETDLFVSELMEALESSGQLEDTVVVFYADHYNYYMMNDALNMEIKGVDSLNLLQHTDFFIYSQDAAPQSVEKYTSSIDVLPTLANLFGLDAEYDLLTGDDAFSEDGGYVFFSDNTWIGGTGDLTEEILERRRISSLLLSGDYWG